MFEVVLLEPEIPPNTGNIARTCAVTLSKLHLIEPFGFELTDKKLKRSGMDYWKSVEWKIWPDWHAFFGSLGSDRTLYFIECGSANSYAETRFKEGDILVFGRESSGLPESLYKKNPDQWISIPMPNKDSRSLNISNCVAIVLFEALRQNGI